MLVMPLAIQAIENVDDRDFMEKLYYDHYRLMYATAWKYSAFGDNVDDVVSDSCVVLIQKVGLLREMKVEKLRAYIISIVRNKTIDANRKAWRSNERTVQEDQEDLNRLTDGSSAEEKYILDEKVRIIREAIGELPWIEQEILRMKCQEGMKAKEIAVMIDIPESDVWKYLKHARHILRQNVWQEERA